MEKKEFVQGRQILINDIAEAKQKLTENPLASQLTLF
jgi:hypothetical protein